MAAEELGTQCVHGTTFLTLASLHLVPRPPQRLRRPYPWLRHPRTHARRVRSGHAQGRGGWCKGRGLPRRTSSPPPLSLSLPLSHPPSLASQSVFSLSHSLCSLLFFPSSPNPSPLSFQSPSFFSLPSPVALSLLPSVSHRRRSCSHQQSHALPPIPHSPSAGHTYATDSPKLRTPRARSHRGLIV